FTVIAWAFSSGSTRRTQGGDFYLATSGDLDLATSGDFLMAMDTLRRPEHAEAFTKGPGESGCEDPS
ncbi:hypothetical protein JW365_08640, partial [Gordonia sp. BP-94]|uniref:hypothetical protein n=1 Tax=Gordonia sp. BP-94 TaxID=2812552 RepID=UPI001963069A